jgi:glycine cleavage system H lipoate-binding protein
MLKKIFDILFNKRNQELTNELKKNLYFKSNGEMSSNSKNTNYEKTLNRGEKFSITAPDLGKNKDVIITNWLKKTDEIIKSGDVICEIENDKVVMELESFVTGKIIYMHSLNQKIKPNTEICIIEGL